jgi:tetratricopeptide (TPR) repeat protein
MNSISDKDRLKRAELYFNQGDLEKAEPLLISLAKSTPYLAAPFYMLGTIYYEKGMFKRAIACYKKALELDPKLTDSAIGLSVVLNDLGRYEEGREVFLKAQSLIKKEKKLVGSKVKDRIAELHLELSRLYQDDQTPDKAMENIVSFENLTGGQTETSLKEKLNIFHITSSFKLACREIETFLEKNENASPEVYMWLAENQYLNHQPLASSLTCEKIIKNFPNYTKAKTFYEKLRKTTFDLNPNKNKGDSSHEKLL